MCGAPESSATYSLHLEGRVGCANGNKTGVGLVPEAVDRSSDLLELAASNNLQVFRRCVEGDGKKVDAEGTWYVRQVVGRRRMVLEQRTPLMIAALFGSLDVVKYIVGIYDTVGGDINQTCGNDCCTALHCAAASGSACAAEVVRVLLDSGANLNSLDADGKRPADVISVSDRHGNAKASLEELLNPKRSSVSHVDFSDLLDDCFLPSSFVDMGAVAAADNGESDTSGSSSTSSISPRDSYASSSLLSSPKSPHSCVTKAFSADGNEKVKEYPVDPSLPDIKSSIFTTDEFRMYSFKIRPCSRAYSHDWTECPFAHPGENARRRDPRRYHYSCVPCPDFRKGVCQQGDSCEYAHGIFECWLHPAQYRTQLCKDGTACSRRVCFFAHTAEELRPLYLSTGSAMPSPKSTAFSDMSPVGSPITPGCTLTRPPFSPTYVVKNTMHGSIMTPPMSPSSAASPWPLSSVPSLHISGGSLSNARLKAALKAHDFSAGDLILSPDVDRRLNEYQSFSGNSLSTQARMNAAVAASRSGSFSGRLQNLEHAVAPTNLEEIFAMESIVSPRSEVQEPLLLPNSHLATKFTAHAHLQSESKHSGDARVQVQAQARILNRQPSEKCHANVASLHSPRRPTLGFFPQVPSCKGANIEMHALNEVPSVPAFVQNQSPGDRVPLMQSDLCLQRGKQGWAVEDGSYLRLMKSVSPGFVDAEEPDLSWIQKLVKEDPLDNAVNAGYNDVLMEGTDVSSWVDKLCLDEVSAN